MNDLFDEEPDELLGIICRYFHENYEDICACDSSSDLDWEALRLANRIDGGNRNCI